MVKAGVIGGAIGMGLGTEDALSESFLYDDKDRLTKADLPAPLTDMNIGYTTNNLGNIASKNGQGTYTYSSSKLYALKTIQNTDNTVSSTTQNITYNIFQQPSLITEDGNTMSFLYGSDDERRKTTRKYNFSGVNNEVEKRTFLGNYEVLETRTCTQLSCTAWTTQQIHYVASGPGYQIIAVRTGTRGAFTFYYAYTDYLGSILRVTNATGALLADGKQSFDAWGRKRNPTTWTYTNIPSTPTWQYRGYTGHETLSQFNLINMNGWLYDPIVGRMLSPDNYVQDATSTQSYNRYSNALNNPLKYRDPSGEFIWIPIIIGAAIGAYSGWQIGEAKGATGWKMAGYILGGAAIGGVAGWAGGSVAAGIGQQAFLGSGLVGATAGGAVGGASSGGGFAALGGGNIGEGIWKGAVSGAAGGLVGGYVGGGSGAFLGGATSGGVGTALYGGDIEDIGKAALFGGAIGWGGYQVQQGIAYHQYQKAGGNWTYKQYSKISTWSQRSFARGREASIRIDQTGKVVFDKWGPRYTRSMGSVTSSFYSTDKEVIHTHAKWGGGFSTGAGGDISAYTNYYSTRPTSTVQFSVVGKYSIYTTNISGTITTVNSSAYAFPYFTFFFGF